MSSTRDRRRLHRPHRRQQPPRHAPPRGTSSSPAQSHARPVQVPSMAIARSTTRRLIHAASSISFGLSVSTSTTRWKCRRRHARTTQLECSPAQYRPALAMHSARREIGTQTSVGKHRQPGFELQAGEVGVMAGLPQAVRSSGRVAHSKLAPPRSSAMACTVCACSSTAGRAAVEFEEQGRCLGQRGLAEQVDGLQ